MTHSKFAAMSGKKAKGSLTRKIKIQAFRHTFNAKLDWEKADEIRVSTEPSRKIAARFGVDKSLVCKIRAGKAWIRYNTPFAGLLR